MTNVFNNAGVEQIGIDGSNSTAIPTYDSGTSPTVLNHCSALTSSSNTIGTVGAGKVWYIVGYSLSYPIDENKAKSNCALSFAGNVVDGITHYCLGTNSGNSGNKTFTFPKGVYPKLTAGQTITCAVDGSGVYGGYASVWYIEEDA